MAEINEVIKAQKAALMEQASVEVKVEGVDEAKAMPEAPSP